MCVQARIAGKEVLCYSLTDGELVFRDSKFQTVDLPEHTEVVEVMEGLGGWRKMPIHSLASLVHHHMEESLLGLKKLSML